MKRTYTTEQPYRSKAMILHYGCEESSTGEVDKLLFHFVYFNGSKNIPTTRDFAEIILN